MIRTRFSVFSLVALISFFATPVLGQTTGTIRGRAMDAKGSPLTGVFIDLRSDVTLRGRTRVTDLDGKFHFHSLPVGRYILRATYEGHREERITDVAVPIAGTAIIDVILHREVFSEEIAVEATTRILTLDRAGVLRNYAADFVDKLPSRRNFWDIISISPGVFQPSEDPLSAFRLSAFGANVQSGAWNIDGVNMTAPEGGYLFWGMNPDIVAETQVISLGAGAEYGSTSGSVFNVVTKSGGDHFGGGARVLFQNDKLTYPNVTLDRTPLGEFHTNTFSETSLTLGGPLRRERVWFFVAYQDERKNISRPGEDPALTNDTDKNRYDVKLSSRLTDGQMLNVKWGTERSYTPWGYDPFLVEESAWKARSLANEIVLSDYSAVIATDTLLELRGGYWRGNTGDLPLVATDEVQFVDFSAFPVRVYGGTFYDWIWEQHHDQADIGVYRYSEHGDSLRQEWKVGFQYSQGGGTTTNLNTVYTYNLPGVQFHYRTGVEPYRYGGDTISNSLFFSDSLLLGERLAVSIGLRYDHHMSRVPALERLDGKGHPTGSFTSGMDMFDWRTWSPRFSIAFKPVVNGGTVFRASVGTYRDGTVAGNWSAPPPDRSPWNTWYVTPDGEELIDSVEVGELLLHPNLRGPRTDEYTLGFQYQFGWSKILSGHIIYRRTADMIGWHILDDGVYEVFEWADPVTGEVFPLFDVFVQPTRLKGNSTGPGALGGDQKYEQEYRGLLLTFEKTYSNGWELVASYTLSRSFGLDTRPLASAEWGQGSPFWEDNSESHPNVWSNAKGLLAGDRTHVLRLVGSFDLPLGFKGGLVLNLQSGRPEKVTRQIVSPSGQLVTFIATPNSHDTRLPSQAIVDLSLRRDFRIFGRFSMSMEFAALNVFNEDAVTYYTSTTLPPGEEFIPSGWVYPARLRIGCRLSF